MKNDEKAIIAGAGAVLAYFLIANNKEKKQIFPMCLYFLRNFTHSIIINNLMSCS